MGILFKYQFQKRFFEVEVGETCSGKFRNSLFHSSPLPQPPIICSSVMEYGENVEDCFRTPVI
jgi:hypothetical protein